MWNPERKQKVEMWTAHVNHNVRVNGTRIYSVAKPARYMCSNVAHRQGLHLLAEKGRNGRLSGLGFRNVGWLWLWPVGQPPPRGATGGVDVNGTRSLAHVGSRCPKSSKKLNHTAAISFLASSNASALLQEGFTHLGAKRRSDSVLISVALSVVLFFVSKSFCCCLHRHVNSVH